MTPASRVAVAAVMAASLGACHHEEPYAKPPTPVRVEQVSPRAADYGIRYAAALEPNLRIDLSFKVPGYVGAIAEVGGADGRRRHIQDGDRVGRGMLLAEVRQDDVEARLAQARAQQAEADAGLRLASDALTRAQALYGSRSLTRPDLEAAQSAYDAAKARLSGARARVEEAQNAIHDSALRSPIDGVVLKRLVEVGSLVAAGTPGLILADTSKVKVVFGVPDVMIGRIRSLERLGVSLEALPGREFTGRVTRVAPVADVKTRAFEVEVTVPNPDDVLKVGMVASLQLPDANTGRQPLAVPLTAIVRSPGRPDGYAVYVVTGAGAQSTARVRDVVLGEMIGNRVEVTDGLRPGDRVIVSGATIVTDGAPVSVVL